MEHNNGLKSCPHCGGPAWINPYYDCRERGYLVFVECEICGARGMAYLLLDDDPGEVDLNDPPYSCAAEAWNMRAKNKIMAARNMAKMQDPF